MFTSIYAFAPQISFKRPFAFHDSSLDVAFNKPVLEQHPQPPPLVVSIHDSVSYKAKAIAHSDTMPQPNPRLAGDVSLLICVLRGSCLSPHCYVTTASTRADVLAVICHNPKPITSD